MDVVDEGFNGFIIFCGVIWKPLGEDGVFNLGDVAIETRFIRGVVIPLSISSLDLVGTIPSLLIHLFFVTHGDVLGVFSVIMLILLTSCSF